MSLKRLVPLAALFLPLLVAGAVHAAESAAFEVPALVSPGVHDWPHLFFSGPETEVARRWVEQEPWAGEVDKQLQRGAEEALAVAPAPLDEGWWSTASSRPWGETYPDVYQHTVAEPMKLAKAAATLATAWLLHPDGNAGYCDHAGRLLLALAPYSFRPEHYDVGLNYAIWGWQMLIAYEVLGPQLSASQRASVDECMTRLARSVAKNDAYWLEHQPGGRINNHLAWHKMILGLLGLFYDRPEMVRYCVDGPWGMRALLAEGLLDDGLWLESSLNYHFTAITPMAVFADAQKNRSSTGPTFLDASENGRKLKQAFDAMFNVVSADRRVPPIGDAYGHHLRLSDVPAYEYAWRLWGDAKYAWLLKRAEKRSPLALFSPLLPPKPPAPPAQSVLLPEHGYVFLRGIWPEATGTSKYWETDAWCTFLTYDRCNVHAHADKLSLMLFGGKRMLISDVEGRATGVHAFSSRIQNELNRGGLSQNTVMIDGADQRCGPRMLRLLECRDLSDEKRVTAADEEGLLYPGVRQMRTLIMTRDYLLDVFQVDCGVKERQIDWIAHIMDETARLETRDNAPAPAPFELPRTGAWAWLRNARSFAPGERCELAWTSERDRLRLSMVSPGQQGVIVCGYPSTDQPASPVIPMLIARQHTARAVFAALWLVGNRPDKAELKALPDNGLWREYLVDTDGRTRRHLVPALR